MSEDWLAFWQEKWKDLLCLTLLNAPSSWYMNEREGTSQLLKLNSVEKSLQRRKASIPCSQLLMQFADLTKFVRNYEDKGQKSVQGWRSNIPVKAWVNAQSENSIFRSTYLLGRNLKWVTLDWSILYKNLHYYKVWKAALFWMHQTVKQIIVKDWKSALLKLLPSMPMAVAGPCCHTSRHSFLWMDLHQSLTLTPSQRGTQ